MQDRSMVKFLRDRTKDTNVVMVDPARYLHLLHEGESNFLVCGIELEGEQNDSKSIHFVERVAWGHSTLYKFITCPFCQVYLYKIDGLNVG